MVRCKIRTSNLRMRCQMFYQSTLGTYTALPRIPTRVQLRSILMQQVVSNPEKFTLVPVSLFAGKTELSDIAQARTFSNLSSCRVSCSFLLMTEEVIEYSVKRLLVSSSQNRWFLKASRGDPGADLSPPSDGRPAELQPSPLPSSSSMSSHSRSSALSDSLQPTGHKSPVQTTGKPSKHSNFTQTQKLLPKGSEEAALEMVLG